jgi:hypothetical protein
MKKYNPHLDRELGLQFCILASEELKVRQWQKKHVNDKHQMSNESTTGGRWTYSFSPTGLGMIRTVTCACGATLNLTDAKNW